MLACLVLAISLGKYLMFYHFIKLYLCLNLKVSKIYFSNSLASVSAINAGTSGWSYPEAGAWPGVCFDGMRQSPIDFDSSMEATVHANLQYRNYFNGLFNKV